MQFRVVSFIKLSFITAGLFCTLTTNASKSSSIYSHVSNDYQSISKPKPHLAVFQDLEPTIVKTAFVDPKWYLAMKEEFEALQRNQTWSLVHTTAAGKIVGSK